MTVTNWAIDHRVAIFVLIIIILIAGFGAYQALPREAAPDITIPYVLVSTPYIGASPDDIETLVTDPLELELEKLKDVEEIRSSSADGFSLISIEFETGMNIDDALVKVRERVDAAESELPDDAMDPMIIELSTSDWPILVVNVSGEVGLVALKNTAEQLQERIEGVQGVLEVELIGGIEREIRVEADPSLLEFYGISLGELINAIQMHNLNMPAGTLELGELAYTVRVPGEFERLVDIENLIVKMVEDEPIFVRDVAQVIDGYEDQNTQSRINGIDSVSLNVKRRSGENLVFIADEVKRIVNEFQQESGAEQLTFTFLADQSEMVEDTVFELENSIITGLLLIAAVLLFFMGGWRNALFVAFAIPLSMLTTFLILSVMGVTLNMVVLFALILALGMLVDNAIVTVENIYRHTHMGKPRIQAAKDAIAEVGWPVIASSATTMGAFIPLLFWPGISGEFMSYLPLTVLVVLASSLFVALVLNPVICSAFMKDKRKGDGELVQIDELEALPKNFFYRGYRYLITFFLNHRWVVGILVPAVFIGTLVIFARFNSGVEFFPRTTPDEVYITTRLPEGSNLEATDRIVRSVERYLSSESNIENFVADVGTGGSWFSTEGSSHLARITVDFLEEADRVENPYDTIERIASMTSTVVGAAVDIEAEEMGPPSGLPINVELVGADYAALGQLAQQVFDLVETVPGIINLQSDYDTGRSEVTVDVDREAAALLGISTSEIAFAVRAAVHGIEASVFRQDEDEYDVIVTLDEENRNDIEDIGDLMITTRDGDYVPITEVADINVGQGFASIQHIDTDRVITVSADVRPGFNENAVLAQVQSLINANLELPAGYQVRYTGASESQDESSQFLGKALLAALFLVTLVLVAQFNRISQPLMIMIAVLLSMTGVLWVLLIRGFPFGIVMTGVAVISLAGVVVNNAIVLVDYINKEIEKGYAIKEAIIRACLVRLRPVLLTAITTCLSLTAMVVGVSMDARSGRLITAGSSAEFWGPMANAVVGGILVATVLTLVVVPVMYSTFEGMKGLFSRKRVKDETQHTSSAKPPVDTTEGAAATVRVEA